MTLATSEKLIKFILFLTAISSICTLFLIMFFVFLEGVPLIFKVGIKNFIFGTKWKPTREIFSIFPMIIGSFYVTFGALLVSVIPALGCAIYLSEFANKKLSAILKPTIELLAGIPSVVYGYIGVSILVPFVKKYIGGNGFSVLTCSIVLGIMILPTITSISYDALRSVPNSYREGALALGATRWQAIRFVVIPAASSGILAAIILGMGRAIGETMAVIMVAGNSLIIPISPLDPVRTLTSNIALEMGYASGIHQKALFATGVVLFIIIMILNTIALKIFKKVAK